MNTQNPNQYYEPKTIQPTGKAIYTSNGWIAIHEVKPKSGCGSTLLVVLSIVTIIAFRLVS